MNNFDDAKKRVIDRFKQMLKGREVYTPVQLVKMGIFGSRTVVHRLIKAGKLEKAYTSNLRIVIFREDLIKFLEDQQV